MYPGAVAAKENQYINVLADALRAEGAEVSDCNHYCSFRPIDIFHVHWPERIHTLGIRLASFIDVAFRVRENRHPQFGGAEMELCDLRLSRQAEAAVC